MFSRECEHFLKNTYFEEHLRTAASLSALNTILYLIILKKQGILYSNKIFQPSNRRNVLDCKSVTLVNSHWRWWSGLYFQLMLFHCVKSVQIRSCFWSVFSCIRTKYGDLQCRSPYLARIQENTDQN